MSFLKRLASHLGVNLDVMDTKFGNESELAATVLDEINKFLYQKKESIPSEYISEFHQYWKENHEEVLSPQINPNEECLEVAKILEEV